MSELTLKDYFRTTGNRPQTVAEIAAGMGRDTTYVRSAIRSLRHRMLIFDTPRRYSFAPGALNPPPVPAASAERIRAATAAFCEKWGVSTPEEATRRNPEALTEWCERLAA